VDGLVNNAGILIGKAFTDYTSDDLKALVHTNLEGYMYITQLVVKQMLAQKRGGSVVGVTTTALSNPLSGMNVSVAMMTKGGIDGANRNLAIEYAKDHIRFNLVVPGIVDTPMHKDNPKDFLKTLSPMGTISSAEQIADGIVFLTEAQQVSGEVLHIGGGSQRGRWTPFSGKLLALFRVLMLSYGRCAVNTVRTIWKRQHLPDHNPGIGTKGLRYRSTYVGATGTAPVPRWRNCPKGSG